MGPAFLASQRGISANSDGLWPSKWQRHSEVPARSTVEGLPAQMDLRYCEGTFCVPRLAVSTQPISLPRLHPRALMASSGGTLELLPGADAWAFCSHRAALPGAVYQSFSAGRQPPVLSCAWSLLTGPRREDAAWVEDAVWSGSKHRRLGAHPRPWSLNALLFATKSIYPLKKHPVAKVPGKKPCCWGGGGRGRIPQALWASNRL